MNLSKIIRQILAKCIYAAYGTDFFSCYKWLISTFNWSVEKRRAWRLKRLGDILEYAWNKVPFYREYWGDHGVDFFRPRSLEELEKYPILTKEIFRTNAPLICSTELNNIRYRTWHTGGTTGEPVHYYRDLEQWVLCEAFHLWGWTQLGYSFGDPVGVLAGGSLIPEKTSFEGVIRKWLHNRIFLFGIAMNKELALRYYKIFLNKKIKYLYGYPSIIYLFGRYLKKYGFSIPSLKAVITTAEMLTNHYRNGIEQSLGCVVFDNLGCNDGGYEAYECHHHHGYHYNDLQSILEVEKSESSDFGKLLITNLWNRSMPFIRYENGDIVTLGNQSCPCGVPFPLISSIQGRTADILYFANGKSLAGPGLTLIFAKMDIHSWQIVQTGPLELEIRIVSFSKSKNAQYEKEIQKILAYHLGDEVKLKIRFVSELERTSAGKLKRIWCAI